MDLGINKQQILFYATFKIGFFYNREGDCLQRGTH